MKKKILALVLLIVITVSMGACGDSGGNEPNAVADKPVESTDTTKDTSHEPDSEPEVDTELVQEDAYEITYKSVKTYTNSIGTAYAQVIVEIENTGTVDLYMSSGSYDLEDAGGKLIKSNSMVSTYPEVISPGEKAYMYEEDMLDEAVDGELTVLPRPDVEKAKIDNIRYNVTDLEILTDKYGFLKVKGRVENTTEEDEDGLIYVVLILKDANGTPIGQTFTIIMEDFAAGDKIGFEVSSPSLPDDVTVDTVASYDVFAYPSRMQF